MCVLPVHGGGWVVGDVVDKPYVPLVEFQGQWVVIILIQQNAIVFLCGHLEETIR